MSEANSKQRKQWPPSRIEEFKLLDELLKECRSIDRANNTIERLKRLIALSEKLTYTDMRKRRLSFIQFLIKQADGVDTP